MQALPGTDATIASASTAARPEAWEAANNAFETVRRRSALSPLITTHVGEKTLYWKKTTLTYIVIGQVVGEDEGKPSNLP